jgi:phenylacetaldehyde dehydrogenase
MAIWNTTQAGGNGSAPAARPMLIGGEWRHASDGRTFHVFDPSSGEPIARVAQGGGADVHLAVSAARRAFDTGRWSRLTPSERGRLVWRLADLVEEHGEELAELESLDNGKPVSVARAADVPLAADLFRYMAGWATKLDGRCLTPSVPYMPDASFHAYTRHEPIGVVAQIIPWNFPLLMASWKVGPALAAGCTVVLKPSEQTPLTALRLGELALEAGFPDGVLNVVTGDGDTGALLAAHTGVDKVAFSGSTKVGRKVAMAAAHDLRKVSLELGGNSPNIVFPDADLDIAVPGAANAIFFNHGQCCTAGSRLYVHRAVFDDVVAGVAELAAQIKLGPGLDPETEMGPLVSLEQLDRVCGYLEAGVREGATAVTGGARHGHTGYFVEPTVLVDTTPAMQVVQEEIFGPVVTAMPFEDPREIVEQANSTIYGLAAGIWTRDLGTAHTLAKAMRAGTVWINCYNVFDASLPFGGYKQSGWGREMGPEALELYMETKAICAQL